MTQLVVECLTKSPLLFLLPLLLIFMRRRVSADIRSKLLIVVFGVALLLPIVIALAPDTAEWQIVSELSLPDPLQSPGAVEEARYSDVSISGNHSKDLQPPPMRHWQIATLTFLLLTFLSISSVCIRTWKTNRDISRLDTVPFGDVRREFERLRDQICPQRSVQLRWHANSASTFAWGILRPTVGVPREISGWSQPKRNAAFVHELSHVRRHDSAAIVFARFVTALYWWNPLAWLTLAQMRHDVECACDDSVLRFGIDAKPYVTFLMEVAAKHTFPVGMTVAMASRGKSLSKRIVALVTNKQRRKTMSKSMQYVSLAVGLATISLLATVQVATAARGEDRDHVRLYATPPIYPSDALANGIEGYVDLEFDIDPTGAAINVRTIRQVPSSGNFEAAAIAAMRTFRYLPRVESGIAVVDKGVRTRVQFALEADAVSVRSDSEPLGPNDLVIMSNSVVRKNHELRRRLTKEALDADAKEDGERFLTLAETALTAQPEMASYFLLRATQLGTDSQDRLAFAKAQVLYELGDLERSLLLFTKIAENSHSNDRATRWIRRIEYGIDRRKSLHDELVSQR